MANTFWALKKEGEKDAVAVFGKNVKSTEKVKPASGEKWLAVCVKEYANRIEKKKKAACPPGTEFIPGATTCSDGSKAPYLCRKESDYNKPNGAFCYGGGM